MYWFKRYNEVINLFLQGPLDVGNFIIGKEGVLDLILALANGGDHVHAVSNLKY